MEQTKKAIDLFSGAGGMSYGFEQSGFVIQLAIEKDAWAVDTYKANHANQNIIEADITTLNDDFFLPYRGKIDIVMGGPPCQGFSIAASNRRKKDDSRNTLYKHFLRVVSIIEPKIVLIENVKEIIGYKLPDGTKIIKDIENFFENANYCYGFSILNCRDYGIPQDRRRFFFLAVKKNYLDINIDLENMMKRFVQREVSFNDAVSDLPIVRPRQFEEGMVLDYEIAPINSFQEIMRGNSTKIYNHIPMQHTDKTVQKFEFLLKNSGGSLPEELKPRVRSHTNIISDASYSQNHRIIDKNKVSPTITASFYSSFIHPSQPRNLTVCSSVLRSVRTMRSRLSLTWIISSSARIGILSIPIILFWRIQPAARKQKTKARMIPETARSWLDRINKMCYTILTE